MNANSCRPPASIPDTQFRQLRSRPREQREQSERSDGATKPTLLDKAWSSNGWKMARAILRRAARAKVPGGKFSPSVIHTDAESAPHSRQRAGLSATGRSIPHAAESCCCRRISTKMPIAERSRITTSGVSLKAVSGAAPSTTKPSTLTAVTNPITIATRTRPARNLRSENIENNVSAAIPRKIAPTTRVSVTAAGESSCIPDRKSTRLNSSHSSMSYAVFCLKKKNLESVSGRAGVALAALASLGGHPPRDLRARSPADYLHALRGTAGQAASLPRDSRHPAWA